MYYVAYDNFLDPEQFGVIKRYLGPGGHFPWELSPRINHNDHINNNNNNNVDNHNYNNNYENHKITAIKTRTMKK